jgi:hypothetical protein
MQKNIALNKKSPVITQLLSGFGGSNNDYKKKYLKYKQKYLLLQNKL